MMLMLEKWSPDHDQYEPSLELSMLLDEAPLFDFSASKSGEPWRMESTLTEASRSADLNSHAWLYVVFLTDPPATWGFRKVRVSADGNIMRAETTVSGVHTGRLLSLKYEVVARHIFHNLCGNDTTGAYKVLLGAQIATCAEARKRESRQLLEKDPLLGYTDYRQSEDSDMTDPSPHPVFASKELGCLFIWQDHRGHREKWYVCHLEGFVEYRFYFIEFQRRPFVKVVMEQLGFVKGSSIPTFEEVCLGHINNIANSIKALSEINASRRFTRASPKEQCSVETDGEHKACLQN